MILLASRKWLPGISSICILLLFVNLLIAYNRVSSQEANRATTAPSVSNKTQQYDVTTTTRPESFNASDITLLSGDEFVDSQEVPTLLFDGLSNENHTSTLRASNNVEDQASSTPAINSSQPPLVQVERTTSIPTSAANGTGNATNVVAEPSDENAAEEGNANEDEDEGTHEEADHITSGQRAFEPPQNVSQYMDYIEKLFHDLRHQITDLFEPHIPQLIRTSQMVDLSSSCSYDMLRLALALRQFEPWALRMIDSSGKVPEGIFEGSFTALGSYDECLNTVFQMSSSHTTAGSSTNGQPATSSASASTSPTGGQSIEKQHQHQQQQQQPALTQGKYCLVTLSPFMPPKPPADKVELMFQEEANRRNYTKDDQFSRLSPMFYYMKFRIGVCIPSTCDQADMDSISSALSSSLRLNITIPDCRVKQANAALTRAQLTGGLVFASVCAIVLCATLLDYSQTRWQKIRQHELRLRNQVASDHFEASALANIDKEHQFKIKIQRLQQHKSYPNESIFEQQLGKHWSWMSFSLLANFRLYFQDRSLPRKQRANVQQKQEGVSHFFVGNKSGTQLPSSISGHINCLNGIRVLSLCWVIVANSYLTLDPRATKRLTKTREAPRDFLFQLVVQASLAIETFFFLSGLLMSLSFARRLQPAIRDPQCATNAAAAAAAATTSKTSANHTEPARGWSKTLLSWLHFYVHRYIRMTPPTMLVIAFSMWAYHFADGPLWFEATQRVHQSCSQNWWRHLLHVANYIDTRQMCFVHYWYIAADMQLFLFAPLLMIMLYKCRHLGYALFILTGSASIGLVFYLTYDRNLPPTLLFYSTDPESRREFGNTIMTKPFTHVLPYLVGMLVGWFLLNSKAKRSGRPIKPSNSIETDGGKISLSGVAGLIVACIALAELFLPYKWNNSHLPGKLMASIYAALFRLGWSLVLAYIVITCRHKRGRRCAQSGSCDGENRLETFRAKSKSNMEENEEEDFCFCPTGGNRINRLLSLNVFGHLSKLSFVAYLIHLPLMSVFIGQTRGLFAFSHTLVIHFAISYLVMTFILAFVLVHIIEFPFLTFERLLFDTWLSTRPTRSSGPPTTNGSGGNFRKFKTIPHDEMIHFNFHQNDLHSHVVGGHHKRATVRPDFSSPGDICERL